MSPCQKPDRKGGQARKHETTKIHIQARSNLDDGLYSCASHHRTLDYLDHTLSQKVTPWPALADARASETGATQKPDRS